MEGFTKKMTFEQRLEGEEISHGGRVFQAVGTGSTKGLSRKTDHVDGDAVKWELVCSKDSMEAV